MNPDLRARTNSRIMLLAKHLPQICRGRMDNILCIVKKKKKRCILYKNCMHFISGVQRWAVPSGCLRDCGGLRRCSTADVNSAWSLDLLQTGRQSLSSLQPTSLSATLAFTKSIMFSLLCHFSHHGELWIFQSFLLWFLYLKLNGASSPREAERAVKKKLNQNKIKTPQVNTSCILVRRDSWNKGEMEPWVCSCVDQDRLR